MRFNCLTLENQHLRFKKYKLILSEYVRSIINTSHFIYTDDSNGYQASLQQAYDIDCVNEIKVEYKWETKDQIKRLEIINRDISSLSKDQFNKVVDNLNELSLFVCYGYISQETKVDILKPYQEEYGIISTEFLNHDIINIVKGIRKEYNNSNISFKGKEIKPDNNSLASIGFLMMSGEPISDYRFEDGSFGELSVDNIKELHRALLDYRQKIIKAEKLTLDHYLKLSNKDKEHLIFNTSEDLKVFFDKTLQGLNNG